MLGGCLILRAELHWHLSLGIYAHNALGRYLYLPNSGLRLSWTCGKALAFRPVCLIPPFCCKLEGHFTFSCIAQF